jgi:hypothetical protein
MVAHRRHWRKAFAPAFRATANGSTLLPAPTGGWQVWKVPSVGGTPIQVTQHGGHAALESLDGKFIFYAKNALAEPEVWRVPVHGGVEVPVPYGASRLMGKLAGYRQRNPVR